MKVVATVLGLLAVPLAAAAQPQPAPRYLVDPPYEKTPAISDIGRYYPPAMLRAEASGISLVDCLVGPKGRFTDCLVAYEKPEGMGLGGAALRLAQQFSVEERTKDGALTAGARVLTPITLRVPKAGGPAPKLPNYRPGRPAYVATMDKTGSPEATVSCATPADGKAQCYLHEFGWSQAPDFSLAAAHIEKLGRKTGNLTMQCITKADGGLTNCSTGTSLSDVETATMSDLLKLYQAPAQTPDGTSTAGSPILVLFDFDAITKVIQASALGRN